MSFSKKEISNLLNISESDVKEFEIWYEMNELLKFKTFYKLNEVELKYHFEKAKRNGFIVKGEKNYEVGVRESLFK